MITTRTIVSGLVAVAAVSLASSTQGGAFYPTTLSENTTGYADSTFTGPPDDVFVGIGGQLVTYDFGLNLVKNIPGPDFNVYEVDWGSPEPDLMQVLVSQDGISFFDVSGTRGAALDLVGDDAHGSPSYRYSFQLPDLWANARYIRIDGDGTGHAGSTTAFDLDAIGAADTVSVSTPDASGCLGLLATGILTLLGLRRRLE